VHTKILNDLKRFKGAKKKKNTFKIKILSLFFAAPRWAKSRTAVGEKPHRGGRKAAPRWAKSRTSVGEKPRSIFLGQSLLKRLEVFPRGLDFLFG
jgi:hypothetical protein